MNNRDEQIAAIAARTDDLDQERLLEFYAEVRRAYEQSSIVERLALLELINDREPSDFRIFNAQELRRIEHFNDKSYMWDMYCKEFGRSVALGEQAYFFEQLQEHIPDVSASPGVGFEGIFDVASRLTRDGFIPDVLLAPISYMTQFLMGEDKHFGWDAHGHEWLLVDGRQIDVFWSSVGRPLDRFILFDHRQGLWTVKADPTTKTRLTVAIGEQLRPVRGVMWLAETVAKYEVLDINGFRSFRPDLRPDHRFEGIR